MSDISAINSSTGDAIDQLVLDAGRMHKVINGTASETVTVEDGSLIPSLRKALLENLYYQTPIIPWDEGSTTQVFNQLYSYTEPTSGAVSWWYAPSATATNPVTMGSDPVTDENWRVILDSATLTGLYATIDSPAFTGLPTAPTVDADDNSDSIATTEFVNALIAKVLQDVSMTKATTVTLKVTGEADIFSLTAVSLNVTGKTTVNDLEILGEVTGIQTSVDGQVIAPKSVGITESLEVGGDTTLHGTFQLQDKTIILGDGTEVDLTNIGTATSISASANLNFEVGNKNFVWEATTLNIPSVGSKGKGISVAKTSAEVTQIAWVDGDTAPWVRTLVSGAWSAWVNTIATQAVALAGTSTKVAVSPSGVKAYVNQFGVGTNAQQMTTDLNTVTLGSVFSFDVGATNAPSTTTGGRGILLPATAGNATMLVVENDNNQIHLRYNTTGTWSAWVEFEGKQGEPGIQGVTGAQGLSAYDIYVESLPEGETPLTEEQWLESLSAANYTKAGATLIATGDTEVVVEHGFSSAPSVCISPVSEMDGSFWISNKESTTFKVNISQPQTADVLFDWIARV